MAAKPISRSPFHPDHPVNAWENVKLSKSADGAYTLATDADLSTAERGIWGLPIIGRLAPDAESLNGNGTP